MRAKYHYRIHGNAIQVSLRGRAPDKSGSIPVGRIVQEYRQETGFMRSWLERMRRADEFYALRYWWACQNQEEYEDCRKRFGEVLETALEKWHKTAKYLNAKKYYQK